MRTWTLIHRSLRHYWRTHVGVVLGAAVATAVLVGALAVGDSVRHSLRAFALARLGKVELALDSGSRFFREQLANELGTSLGATAAPVVRLRAVAISGDRTARANGVQVLGVDERFWRLGPAGIPHVGASGPLAPCATSEPLVATWVRDQVVINERLARQLGVGAGGEILLRVDKPSALSRDAPLMPIKDASLPLTLTVAGVLSDAEFGRFGLQASQIAPYNAFIPLSLLQKEAKIAYAPLYWRLVLEPLSLLQKEAKIAGRANLLLLGEAQAGPTGQAADEALRRVWRLEDAGLELRDITKQKVAELRTDRIFLESAVVQAVEAVPGATGVLTYLVNELRVGERSTPYSMVTAIGKVGAVREPPLPRRDAASESGFPLAPPDLRDDEILINTWLEKHLQAKPGDELEMTYFVVSPTRKLEEEKSRFRIRAAVPMEGLAADRELMPDFPGLADVENCRDWKPGIPIDLEKIKKHKEVEEYWAEHRGTPKAFITLAAGQKIWKNRFGDLTAIRFPMPPEGTEKLREAIRGQIDPASLGLFFRPVREQALAAASQGLDFGQLFLGLSFFLIAAAVLLMGLLFVFGIEQRAEQVGTLLALGFRPRHVRRLLLVEGALLATVGGVAGAFLGTLYTRATIQALSTVWRGAVGSSVVRYHTEPTTLALGALAGIAVAILAMWLTLLRQARRPARELLAGTGGATLVPRPGRRLAGFVVALVMLLAAFVLAASLGARRDQAAVMVFFGAGAALLVGGLALSYGLFCGGARPAELARPTLAGLGWRNAARRRGRSLAVVGLLACATFLVIAVGANRQDPAADAHRRSSGTGGFTFIGESALPVFEDLMGEAGRKAYGLSANEMAGVRIVALRVHEGDDASCLNLNRAQRPRFLGVRPEALDIRKSFTFARTLDSSAAKEPWLLLERRLGEGIVPAIGDEATVTWGLGKSVGDVLDYTDDRGRPFQVRIVGVLASSILQGGLLIGEDDFIERFPSEAGYRLFLIEVPGVNVAEAASRVLDREGQAPVEPGVRTIAVADDGSNVERVSRLLTRALQDVGLELTPTAVRLAEFQTVENTYLSIFQALGGLGLLLGSVGLGVVVLRNVLERRNELAILRAVGFRKRALLWLVLSEHWALLLLGLASGVIAAVIAVLPAIRSPGAGVPVVSLSLTLAAVVVSGLLLTCLAAALALKGPLLSALRTE